MDTRPIGVFDSGLGGLTTVKRLIELLPEEDIIYLGDTGRVPYGSRSRETIIKYARQDAAFLAAFDIKAMVIACNTVCSTAFDVLDAVYDMPVFEVVTAPANAAVHQTKNGKVGVIGTTATIKSGAYETALRKAAPEALVYTAACPVFVPLVEDGIVSYGDISSIAERYLGRLRAAGIDTLIMGCTHYPLLRGVISEVMGAGVSLIDSGAETAKLVAEDLRTGDMLSQSGTAGEVSYFVTDTAEGFSNLASLFMESDVHGMVKQIVLE